MIYCKIISYDEDTDEFGVSHIYFNLTVDDRKRGNAYTLRKRYSDFETLYNTLKDNGHMDPSTSTYAFPNKSLFNNRSAFTLERRMTGFTELLQIVVQIRPLPDDVRAFLEIPTLSVVSTVAAGTEGERVREADMHMASPPTPASSSSTLSPGRHHAHAHAHTLSPAASKDGAERLPAAEAKVKSLLHVIVGAAFAISVAVSVAAVRSGTTPFQRCPAWMTPMRLYPGPPTPLCPTPSVSSGQVRRCPAWMTRLPPTSRPR